MVCSGVWQTTEALPLLFRSSVPLGVLPTIDEVRSPPPIAFSIPHTRHHQNPSWLPVDIAGAAIIDLVLRPRQPKSAVYHVVNPDVSTPWSAILAGMRAGGLKFDAVERREWVLRLAESDSDGEVNPTYKLLACLPPELQLRLDTDSLTSRSTVVGTGRMSSASRCTSARTRQARRARRSRSARRSARS